MQPASRVYKGISKTRGSLFESPSKKDYRRLDPRNSTEAIMLDFMQSLWGRMWAMLGSGVLDHVLTQAYPKP